MSGYYFATPANQTDWCGTTGIMRWNSSTQCREVMMDGSGISWTPFPQVNAAALPAQLDPTATMLLDWCQQKMNEEKELAALCEKHPGLKETKEKYEIMLALVKEHKS